MFFFKLRTSPENGDASNAEQKKDEMTMNINNSNNNNDDVTRGNTTAKKSTSTSDTMTIEASDVSKTNVNSFQYMWDSIMEQTDFTLECEPVKGKKSRLTSYMNNNEVSQDKPHDGVESSHVFLDDCDTKSCTIEWHGESEHTKNSYPNSEIATSSAAAVEMKLAEELVPAPTDHVDGVTEPEPGAWDSPEPSEHGVSDSWNALVQNTAALASSNVTSTEMMTRSDTNNNDTRYTSDKSTSPCAGRTDPTTSVRANNSTSSRAHERADDKQQQVVDVPADYARVKRRHQERYSRKQQADNLLAKIRRQTKETGPQPIAFLDKARNVPKWMLAEQRMFALQHKTSSGAGAKKHTMMTWNHHHKHAHKSQTSTSDKPTSYNSCSGGGGTHRDWPKSSLKMRMKHSHSRREKQLRHSNSRQHQPPHAGYSSPQTTTTAAAPSSGFVWIPSYPEAMVVDMSLTGDAHAQEQFMKRERKRAIPIRHPETLREVCVETMSAALKPTLDRSANIVVVDAMGDHEAQASSRGHLLQSPAVRHQLNDSFCSLSPWSEHLPGDVSCTSSGWEASGDESTEETALPIQRDRQTHKHKIRSLRHKRCSKFMGIAAETKSAATAAENTLGGNKLLDAMLNTTAPRQGTKHCGSLSDCVRYDDESIVSIVSSEKKREFTDNLTYHHTTKVTEQKLSVKGSSSERMTKSSGADDIDEIVRNCEKLSLMMIGSLNSNQELRNSLQADKGKGRKQQTTPGRKHSRQDDSSGGAVCPMFHSPTTKDSKLLARQQHSAGLDSDSGASSSRSSAMLAANTFCDPMDYHHHQSHQVQLHIDSDISEEPIVQASSVLEATELEHSIDFMHSAATPAASMTQSMTRLTPNFLPPAPTSVYVNSVHYGRSYAPPPVEHLHGNNTTVYTQAMQPLYMPSHAMPAAPSPTFMSIVRPTSIPHQANIHLPPPPPPPGSFLPPMHRAPPLLPPVNNRPICYRLQAPPPPPPTSSGTAFYCYIRR